MDLRLVKINGNGERVPLIHFRPQNYVGSVWYLAIKTHLPLVSISA